jgi:hypothetical protein
MDRKDGEPAAAIPDYGLSPARALWYLWSPALTAARAGKNNMAEKSVLIGVVPETVVVGPRDQVTWYTDAGNFKIEFDPHRCPFSSNVYQAPPGMRLVSGPARLGAKPGSYKYKIIIEDTVIARGEIILRES